MKRHQFILATGLAIFFIFSLFGCNSGGGGGGDDETCPEPTLDISLCDPDTVIFSTTIDNEFFPLTGDTELVLEGEDDGETVRVEITVPGDTEMVAGVETLVMIETEYEDGELVEVSWDEALEYTASRLKEIQKANGPDAVGFFASAKVTNEENYLMQKFARAGVGTNNVDHCARL